MSFRRLLIVAVAIAVLGLAVGCAAGPNPVEGSGAPAGFWLGLWHGFIAPFTLIVSFFSDQVNIYEVHNNGGWYNFGFVFGASIFFGGGGGAGARAARR
jgi:hypothetical protein